MVVGSVVVMRLLRCGATALRMAGRHVGPILVPCAAWEHLDHEARRGCKAAGFAVVEATLDQLIEAADRPAGVTQREQVGLVLARDGRHGCVSEAGPAFDAGRRLGLRVWSPIQVIQQLASDGRLGVGDAARLLRTLGLAKEDVSVVAVSPRKRSR